MLNVKETTSKTNRNLTLLTRFIRLQERFRFKLLTKKWWSNFKGKFTIMSKFTTNISMVRIENLRVRVSVDNVSHNQTSTTTLFYDIRLIEYLLS